MNLKVKALNPDCEAEITQLCALYARCYSTQLLTPVDASRFWKSRVGNRFSTLLVLSGTKYIASVSLRPDRENPAHIQLYLAACDPQYLSQAAEIRTAITDLMHRLSMRQKWEMIYSYQFLQLPEQAWFSHFLVDGIDVALWPASLPSGTKKDKKAVNPETNAGLGSALISQRILATPANHFDEKAILFAPKEHVKFCSWIYSSLGLSFNVTHDLNEASKIAGTSKNEGAKFKAAGNISLNANLALSADRRAIERQSHRQAGFCLTFVEPSLVSNFKDLEKILQRRALATDYVALNMLDPNTPQFGENLEKIGFGLGGVLPYHRNRHTLLYFRTATSFDWQSLKQTSPLFDYLKTKDSEHLPRDIVRTAKKVPVVSTKAA